MLPGNDGSTLRDEVYTEGIIGVRGDEGMAVGCFCVSFECEEGVVEGVGIVLVKGRAGCLREHGVESQEQVFIASVVVVDYPDSVGPTALRIDFFALKSWATSRKGVRVDEKCNWEER